MERLREAKTLFAAGDVEGGLSWLKRYLNGHPTDAEAIYVMASTLFDQGDHGLAYQLFERVIRLAPEKAAGYTGLGRCMDQLGDNESALALYKRALEHEPDYYWALCNAGTAFLKMGRLEEAEGLYLQAVEVNSDERTALANLGMVYLATGQWSDAWPMVQLQIGQGERPERFYGDAEMWLPAGPDEIRTKLPSGRWSDEPERLVVYGEQGIGDEVFYAACLPDLNGHQVAIETDHRLRGLFQRSFPWAAVHGTRRVPAPAWVDGFNPTHKAPISALPGWFRRSPDDCPRRPYLTACPARRKAVRALLDDLPGLKIGVAWTGGAPVTGGFERQIDAEWLLEGLGVSPFSDADISLVSLQYKNPPVVAGIHHWPWLTESQDYDDTAALVAELDAVISVPTSVVNLAGALGTPTWVLLPDGYHHWRYGTGGRDHRWYESLTIVREPWDMAEVLREVRDAVGG